MSKPKKAIKSVLFYIVMAAISLVCIFPFVMMVQISIKPAIYTYNPSVWIFTPTFENFKKIIEFRNIFSYMLNSLVIVVVTTIISLILGSFAAYGFARFSFKRRENLAFFILSQRMLPPIAVVIPFFVMASLFSLLDSKLILIIAYMLINIPFVIWMMRSFFEDIPISVEESARVEGCSNLQVLYRIVLPLSLPGLIATAIFCVINSWNEFVFALFLTSMNSRTLPTSVTLFMSVNGVMWGEMAAVGLLAATPVIVFAMIVQKNMIRGLTFGAVKE